MCTSCGWEGKGRYGSFRLQMNVWVCRKKCEIPCEHAPYLSASAVVIHYEEALYQVYAPLTDREKVWRYFWPFECITQVFWLAFVRLRRSGINVLIDRDYAVLRVVQTVRSDLCQSSLQKTTSNVVWDRRSYRQDRPQTKKNRSWSWSWPCGSGVVLCNTIL